MTFDPTKPVQTRDGRKARIIATDRRGASYPIVALVNSKNSKEELIVTYLADGSEIGCIARNPLDLVNIPEERELWVIVYDDGYGAYPSREMAEGRSMGRTCIARLRIRYTEGQWDE